MKRVLYLSILLSFALLACSEADSLYPDSDMYSDSKPVQRPENEFIVPLDSTQFVKAPLKSRGMPVDLGTELYQLNGIDFFIQSKDSYFGKNTFQSYGRGQEVKLETFSSTNLRVFS